MSSCQVDRRRRCSPGRRFRTERNIPPRLIGQPEARHLKCCILRSDMSRSSSSVMIMSALLLTWLSYFLLWMSFPSRSPTVARADTITTRRSDGSAEYPARPTGVVFISHAASGPVREAVYALSRYGYQVLVGVKDKVERRSYLYSLRKGIELIDFDVADPATYPPLIYRLRHIRRDLDRPVVAAVINIADELRVAKMKPKDAIDLAYLEERYRAVTKNPFRIVQALLELNRHQVNDDARAQRRSPREAWLTDGAAADADNSSTASTTVPKYPWNAQAFRVTLVTRDYSEREALDASFICDLDCLQQQLLVDYVRTLFRPETQVVHNASLSVVRTSWETRAVRAVEGRGSSTADVVGFAQGIDWAVDISGEEEAADNAALKEEDQVMRAVVHSLVSRRPAAYYDAKDFRDRALRLPPFPR